MEESDCQLTLIHTMIPKIFSSHISPFETEFWHQSQFTVGCRVRDIVSLKTRNLNIAELVLFTSWALSQSYRTTLSHNCTCPTWPDLLWFSPFLHRVGSHLELVMCVEQDYVVHWGVSQKNYMIFYLNYGKKVFLHAPPYEVFPK